MNTKRVYIKDLNANDVFTLPGERTEYVCESRRQDGMWTRIDYRVKGGDLRSTFTRTSLSTADLFTD